MKQQETVKEKSIKDFMLDGKRKLDRHQHGFRRIFGRSIGDFRDPVFGFDLVKFDREIVRACDLDGISCREKLLTDFGQEAADMIEDLVD